ncbi:MAG: biopolymer transporter ExbD, partial [Myxococcales bacterium]|nr:biopolymer transporter ExbD [Myxococcales bacterium]
DINVTPLVDVVLVLLIILMVTATAIVSKTIKMELPEAQTGENTPQSQTLAVSIARSGELFLDANPVSAEELRSKVHAAQASKSDVRAIIAADGQVPHSKVVQVIDLLRQEKVTKFAINVKPSDLEH